MRISSRITEDGIAVSFRGKEYSISYPPEVWRAAPKYTQTALHDNLVLAVTMHLPIVLSEKSITYDSGRPLLEPYFTQNFLRDIPSCTEVDGTNTANVVRQFFNTEYIFEDSTIKMPSEDPVQRPHRALVGMSFGKDSLLSYAVAHEIGLDPEIVYVVEQSLTYEEKHKRVLADAFVREFGKSLHILQHETGKLRDYNHLGLPQSEFGWGLQTTEYALEFIPFAYFLNARYLLFGNEQSTAATYMGKDGWTIYPCYDQHHLWTVQLDEITQRFSGRAVRTASLIEPLMDMMIQTILVNRYPDIAKYQMSCFTDTEAGREYRWCHHCSVCAKMHLLCAGGGVDPRAIGLKKNMLDRDSKNFFTIFGGRSKLTYANTKLAYDEQLFAFYNAVRKGAKGHLIDEFRSSELMSEAKSREDELVNKFCSLYAPISIPDEIKDAVLSIYSDELEQFEI